MTYTLQDDIEHGMIDHARIESLNRGMSTVTNRLVLGIDEQRDLDAEFSLVLQFLLKSFPITHESIIAILLHNNEEKFNGDESKPVVPRFGPDAMLLVRDQLEKVFTITLLLSDPGKWMSIYSQDDWRRAYERHLYEKIEKENLSRFTEYHGNIAPQALENLRVRSGVSDAQKEWVEFKYHNPGAALPDHLRNHKVVEFPTAGAARKELSAHESASMLQRLYKEYKYLSGYAHSGAIKMFAQGISDRRLSVSQENKERFFQNENLGPAIVTSYCESLAACTETFQHFNGDIDLLAALTTQWEHLKEISLLAKALWDLRGSNVLAFEFGTNS
jgi:hypothetical protein